ncbi:MAG: LysE family transporter [Candidatus Competibacteraceae bacterium]
MLLKGLLIGFAIAAPVGPIGLLCIQRTLQRGRIAGFISGLGAASADAVYGSIAGFGLVSLSGLLLDWRQELRRLGGIFLLYLGWRLFSSLPTEQNSALRSTDLMEDYASTFLLTLTNPVTILAFIGIFTGLGLAAGERNFNAAGLLVLGVFLGSLLWWLLLALAVGALRRRLSPATRRRLNRAAGTVIALFGALALLG